MDYDTLRGTSAALNEHYTRSMLLLHIVTVSPKNLCSPCYVVALFSQCICLYTCMRAFM